MNVPAAVTGVFIVMVVPDAILMLLKFAEPVPALIAALAEPKVTVAVP